MVTKRRNYTKRRKPKTNRRNTKRHTKRRNVKRRNTKKRNHSKKSNKILIQEGGMLGCSRRPSKKESKANRRIQVKECTPMLSSAGADATAADATAAGATAAGATAADATAAGATAASARPPEMTGSNRKGLEMLAEKLGIDAEDYEDDSKLELILKILRKDYYFSEIDPVPKRSPPSPSLSEADGDDEEEQGSVKKDPILDYAEKTADMILANQDMPEKTIRDIAKSETMEVLEDKVGYPFKLKSEIFNRYHGARRKEEEEKESSRVPFYHQLKSPEPEPEPSDDLKAFMRDQKAEEASKERMRLQASRRAWIAENSL